MTACQQPPQSIIKITDGLEEEEKPLLLLAEPHESPLKLTEQSSQPQADVLSYTLPSGTNFLKPQILGNSVANFKKFGLQTCRSNQLKNFMHEIKLSFSPLSSTNQCQFAGKAPDTKASEHIEINEEDEIFRTVDEDQKVSDDMEDLLQEPPHISRKFKFPMAQMQKEAKRGQQSHELQLGLEQYAHVPLLKLDSFDDKLHIEKLQQQLEEKD